MTNKPQPLPTDAEIVALMRDGNNCNYNDEAEHIDFARAVLTKWGTPAPVGVEPFAWTDDGSTRSGATATSHRVVTNETKKSMPAAAAVSFTVPLYTAEVLAVPLTDEQTRAMLNKHPPEDVCGWSYRMGIDDAELHHGIKGGQHGTE